MARVGNKFALSGRLGLNSKNFKKGLRGAGQKYNSFQRNIRDKNHIIGRSFKNLNKKINTGFKRAAFVGLGSLTLGLGIAAREFVNFDQAIVSSIAKFKSLETITESTEKNLRDTARKVGETTHFTATQAAQGLNFYAKAGFKAVEAISVLANTADLATVAEMDLNRAADISSDLLSSLGLNSEDSATKIKNLGMMNRALGLSVNMANVNLEDMFETLKTAGPIASDIGGTTNEIIAMTAALGGAGIKGSLASTALRSMYGRLIKPTGDVLKRMNMLNISQQDFLRPDGSMDMIKAMQKIGDATKGLTKVQRGAAFFDLFGLRAVAGASNLSKSLSQVGTIIKKLKSDAKISDIAEEMRKGLLMQLQTLGSTALEKAFQFFDAFTENGKDGIKQLTEWVRELDVAPFVEFAKTAIEVLKFIGRNWKVLLSLAIGIKAVSIAMALAEFAVAAFGLTFGAAFAPILLGLAAVALAMYTILEVMDDLEERQAHNKVMKNLKEQNKAADEQLRIVKRIKEMKESGNTSSPEFDSLVRKRHNFLARTNKNLAPINQEPQILNSAYRDSITPKSVSYTNYDFQKGSLDINFNGAPAGTGISQSGSVGNQNIKINPVLQP